MPGTGDFDQTSAITCDFLTEFLTRFFSSTFTPLVDSQCAATGFNTDPVSINFQVAAIFDENADPQALPDADDIDLVIAVAFQPPEETTLLNTLRDLDSPFSSTQDTIYSQI